MHEFNSRILFLRHNAEGIQAAMRDALSIIFKHACVWTLLGYPRYTYRSRGGALGIVNRSRTGLSERRDVSLLQNPPRQWVPGFFPGVKRSESPADHLLPSTAEINPLNAELHPNRHLLALVGARHIVHVSKIRVKDDCTCTSPPPTCRGQGQL